MQFFILLNINLLFPPLLSDKTTDSARKLPVRKIEPPDDGVDETGFGEVAETKIGAILVHLRCVLTVVNLVRTSVRRH